MRPVGVSLLSALVLGAVILAPLLLVPIDLYSTSSRSEPNPQIANELAALRTQLAAMRDRVASLEEAVQDLSFAGETAPYYLELDIPAGMMYWGEENNSRIFRGRMDGAGLSEEFLTGLNRVRDIGLDLAQR